jgi:hypothetical protein
LPELAPSPWRSLGKRLDYSEWVERDRFIELDAAILTRQELEPQWNTPPSGGSPDRRSCRARLAVQLPREPAGPSDKRSDLPPPSPTPRLSAAVSIFWAICLLLTWAHSITIHYHAAIVRGFARNLSAAISPIRSAYPFGFSVERPVIVHRFGSLDAKQEQRYYLGRRSR